VYEVFLERRAQSDLDRLAPDVFRRIIRAVKGLASDPRPSGCRKLIGSQSGWRIRVGDYRVVYEVDDKVKAVRVMFVRHRREAYR
jgi:mRNA interferase RelE/StbE